MSRHNRERREIKEKVRKLGPRYLDYLTAYEVTRIRKHGKRKLAAREAKS